jgi:hypothetical protein
MVEMLVSLVVMILLLGITAVIYKSANDAMHLSNSEILVVDDFNTLTEQVDLTMENVSTDGYLVIYGYDVQDRVDDDKIVEKNSAGKILYDGSVLPSVRSDAICFLTTGNFKSQTDQSISSNAAWVYLGHAGSVNPSTYGSSPFDTVSAANPLVPNRWVLSRYMLLFSPTATGVDIGDDYRATSMGAYLTWVKKELDGQPDTDIRDWFYEHWIDDYNNPISSEKTIFTPPAINFDNEDFTYESQTIPAGCTFPYTLGNVGSIKIEFAMPKSYFNTATILYASDEPEQYGDGNIIWRSAINRDPENPDDTTHSHSPYAAYALDGSDNDTTHATLNPANADTLGKRSTHDAIVVFGPDDIWPLFIKITIRKYDEDLTVKSDEKFDNGDTHLHGGRTLEYIYKLPVKN